MIRKKTKFEEFFSLNKYIRRYKISEEFLGIKLNFEEQKKIIIEGEVATYTHGSNKRVSEHLQNLEKEFIGQKQICYTHAKLIVLIRRGYKPKKIYTIFDELWKTEKKFLLANLNTRWLMSAADTIADQSNDQSQVALAIACSCLVNSVKIYESERFLTDAESNIDNIDKQRDLDNEMRFSLFDGMSVFKYGTDDTLRNMRWRINKVCKDNIAGEIFLELFKRFNHFDTAYKRAKDRHNRNRTAWWE